MIHTSRTAHARPLRRACVVKVMSQWGLVSASGTLNPSKTATSGTATQATSGKATQATITSASKSMVSAVVFAGKALHEGELFCWNADLHGSMLAKGDGTVTARVVKIV